MNARGSRWIVATAWIAILAVVTLAITEAVQSRGAPRRGPDAACVAIVRSALALPDVSNGRDVRSRLAAMPQGRPYEAVLAADLEGPAAGARVLRRGAEAGASATGSGGRATTILLGLWDGPPADLGARMQAIGRPDRDALVADLGWVGRLALLPPGVDDEERARLLEGARLRTIATGAFAVLAFLLGVAGLIGAIVWFAILRRPLPAPRYAPGAGPQPASIAAAAALLVAFVALAHLRAGPFAGIPQFGAIPAAVKIALTVGAVVCLARFAPPAAEARRVAGWTLGAGIPREIGAACAAFPLHIIIVVIGTATSLAVHAAAGLDPAASAHPASSIAAGTAGLAFAGLLLDASVAAPILEETLFRGLLYHHLRSATATWRRWRSVVLSALVQAVLFGLMHPQGPAALPILASIGFGLALLREWRGSLVAPMFVHGVWNGSIFVVTAVGTG